MVNWLLIARDGIHATHVRAIHEWQIKYVYDR